MPVVAGWFLPARGWEKGSFLVEMSGLRTDWMPPSRIV